MSGPDKKSTMEQAPGRLYRLESLCRLGAALALLALSPLAAFATTTTLVEKGSVWKYLDNGTDPGKEWPTAGFSDAGWSSGPAQLGYGDGDEATVVGYGPRTSRKFITTYFRKTFTVPDPASMVGLTLRVLRDDGAVVYLNGTEVWRTNMPKGEITSATKASSSHNESSFSQTGLPGTLLQKGENLLAVEVHQAGPSSSDLSFDLELIGSDTPSVTRGPYLQTGTPTSVIVRWRTNGMTDSQLRYGPAPDRLTSAVTLAAPTTEHIVPLTGLQPDTRYYYSVGTASSALTGGDSETFFVTSPPAGSEKKARIWVLGDSGTANANARGVRDGYLAFTGSRHTDLWLMLGDNAYNTGLDTEYQAAVFDTYPSMLRKSVLWPTLGNHDAVNAFSATQSGPYYDMFTLPKNGEAGGLPSGTEAYYSFDYGRIHFVCLDSQDTDRATTGPMLTWLKNDLAATTQDWIIAFFHHPPYTRGSHNSDHPKDSGGRLADMRENALPILEAAGVDLVLAGHSHSYERSFLLNGHYGLSGTLTPAMKLDGGSGRPDETGAYRKNTAGNGTNDGAVYAVAGSSGKISGGPLDHPAMFISLNTLGSMVLDVDRNQMDAKFLGVSGDLLDHFTLVKDAAAVPAVRSVTRLDSSPTTAGQLRYRVELTQSVTGVDAADFAVTATGSAAGSVASVSGDGSTWEVTVNRSGGEGTLRLDVADDDSIRNGVKTPLGGAGAANGAFQSGEAYQVAPAAGTTGTN